MAGHQLPVLGLGDDREIRRLHQQCRLCLADPHTTRPRHPRRLRPAEVGIRAHAQGRPAGAGSHDDRGARRGVSRDLPWGRIALAFLGYIAAILISVNVTVFAILAPSALPDHGAWGSFYANKRDLGFIYSLGFIITPLTALPGFLLTLFVARRGGWVGWLPFACAGTLSAVLALAIFNVAMQMPLLPLTILLPCLPGGFAGGLAYWAAVRRSLPSNEEWFWP